MFEGLDGIPWNKLSQAHGTAEHVPDAIRGLVSIDSSIRESSYWKLDNHIVLQSDLYEAAYYSISYLVEIVRDEHVVDKSHAYDLLFEIANGSCDRSIQVIHNNHELTLSDACRTAIAEFADMFFDHLGEKEGAYKGTVLDLLETLLDVIPDCRSRLKKLCSEGCTQEDRVRINEILACDRSPST